MIENQLRVIDEVDTDYPVQCEWPTFTESGGKVCLTFATKAIQERMDLDDPEDYECIAHLCVNHIDRAWEITNAELS